MDTLGSALTRVVPWLVFGLLSVLGAEAPYASKTDTVTLANGDAITGEVESMEFGSLRYSTDSMGTVEIVWEDVVAVLSNQALQVETVTGERYFGNLTATDARRSLLVNTEEGQVELQTARIFRITPIETAEQLVKRLTGDFSLGATTQKGSQVSTLNLSTGVSYRSRKYLIGLDANSTITNQDNLDPLSRHNVSVNYQRFRRNRFFVEGLSRWERNDETGVDSRLYVGGNFGRYVIQTNKNQLSLKLGIVQTGTIFVGDAERTLETEGLVQLRYQHRHRDPDAFVSLVTTVYPTVTDLGAYRAESDLSLRRDLFGDVYFELSVYQTFQSDPPPDSAKSDYGIVTSLGYSF